MPLFRKTGGSWSNKSSPAATQASLSGEETKVEKTESYRYKRLFKKRGTAEAAIKKKKCFMPGTLAARRIKQMQMSTNPLRASASFQKLV
jgi:hypothetical protein